MLKKSLNYTCLILALHFDLYITGDQELLAFLKEELQYEKDSMQGLPKPKLDEFNKVVGYLFIYSVSNQIGS